MAVKFEEQFNHRDESKVNAPGGSSLRNRKKSLFYGDFPDFAEFGLPSCLANR